MHQVCLHVRVCMRGGGVGHNNYRFVNVHEDILMSRMGPRHGDCNMTRHCDRRPSSVWCDVGPNFNCDAIPCCLKWIAVERLNIVPAAYAAEVCRMLKLRTSLCGNTS